mgnify:CR=1 FL=1|jgi:hypothetical protein
MGAVVEEDSMLRIERVITKISDLVERVANEEALIQELSGNIELLRENLEIVRASVLKEDHGDGEHIKDQISF